MLPLSHSRPEFRCGDRRVEDCATRLTQFPPPRKNVVVPLATNFDDDVGIDQNRHRLPGLSGRLSRRSPRTYSSVESGRSVRSFQIPTRPPWPCAAPPNCQGSDHARLDALGRRWWCPGSGQACGGRSTDRRQDKAGFVARCILHIAPFPGGPFISTRSGAPRPRTPRCATFSRPSARPLSRRCARRKLRIL